MLMQSNVLISCCVIPYKSTSAGPNCSLVILNTVLYYFKKNFNTSIWAEFHSPVIDFTYGGQRLSEVVWILSSVRHKPGAFTETLER